MAGNGKSHSKREKELVSISIDEEIAKSGDKEMIEDLVVAAVNKRCNQPVKWLKMNWGSVTKNASS